MEYIYEILSALVFAIIWSVIIFSIANKKLN